MTKRDGAIDRPVDYPVGPGADPMTTRPRPARASSPIAQPRPPACLGPPARCAPRRDVGREHTRLANINAPPRSQVTLGP